MFNNNKKVIVIVKLMNVILYTLQKKTKYCVYKQRHKHVCNNSVTYMHILGM